MQKPEIITSTPAFANSSLATPSFASCTNNCNAFGCSSLLAPLGIPLGDGRQGQVSSTRSKGSRRGRSKAATGALSSSARACYSLLPAYTVRSPTSPSTSADTHQLERFTRSLSTCSAAAFSSPVSSSPTVPSAVLLQSTSRMSTHLAHTRRDAGILRASTKRS